MIVTKNIGVGSYFGLGGRGLKRLMSDRRRGGGVNIFPLPFGNF